MTSEMFSQVNVKIIEPAKCFGICFGIFAGKYLKCGPLISDDAESGNMLFESQLHQSNRFFCKLFSNLDVNVLFSLNIIKRRP